MDGLIAVPVLPCRQADEAPSSAAAMESSVQTARFPGWDGVCSVFTADSTLRSQILVLPSPGKHLLTGHRFGQCDLDTGYVNWEEIRAHLLGLSHV